VAKLSTTFIDQYESFTEAADILLCVIHYPCHGFLWTW